MWDMVRHFLICFCVLYLAQELPARKILPDYNGWEEKYAYLEKNDPAALPSSGMTS